MNISTLRLLLVTLCMITNECGEYHNLHALATRNFLKFFSAVIKSVRNKLEVKLQSTPSVWSIICRTGMKIMSTFRISCFYSKMEQEYSQ